MFVCRGFCRWKGAHDEGVTFCQLPRVRTSTIENQVGQPVTSKAMTSPTLVQLANRLSEEAN